MRPLLAILIAIGFAGAAAAADMAVKSMPYPSAVALSEPNPGKWIYKSFPGLLALYIFDGEPAGQSTCDSVCSAVWPIIRAEANDKPMGLWTIVKRDDGRFQWAFRNKPVYTYFEDQPNEARGGGKDKDWYLDEGAAEYLRKAGVQLPSLPANAIRKKSEGKGSAAVLLIP